MQHHFFIRKLLSTFGSTVIVATVMFFLSEYDQPKNFIKSDFPLGVFSLAIYIGAIVLVYGNAVSAGIEWVTTKWLEIHSFFYILLHGLFGLIMIGEPLLAVFAVATALLFGAIDRLVYDRLNKGETLRYFLITPVVIFGSLWIVFLFTQPDPPPFTADDAVRSVTSTEGTYESKFPKKAGVITEGIVTRETRVKEVENEVYLVTLTQTWNSEEASRPTISTYKVDRGSVSAYNSKK